MKKYFTLLVTCFMMCNYIAAQTCPSNTPKAKRCEEPKSSTIKNETIKICKGCHFGGRHAPCAVDPNICYISGESPCIAPNARKSVKSSPTFRVVNFGAFFLESTIYDKSDLFTPSDVGDMNKLMRIYSTKPCDNDQYYLSLGWRYRKADDGVTDSPFTQEGMELALYGHIDHRDQSPKECKQNHNSRINIPTGSIIPKANIEANGDGTGGTLQGPLIELIMSSNGYFVKTYRRGIAIRRDFTLEDCPFPTPAITKVRKDAFFGGNNCAPHTMKIKTAGPTGYNGIKVDHIPTWWTDTDYKGYFGSEFYDGETVVIYAKDEIDFTISPLAPTPARKNIIYSGANVTMRVAPGGTLVVDAITGNPEGVEVQNGATVDARPLNIGETAPTNTGLIINYADKKCNGGNKWEEENETYFEEEVFEEEELLEDENNNITFTLHPNPSDGNFELQINNYESGVSNAVIIYDMLGREIYQSKIVNPKSEIDISSQRQGLYVVKVVLGEKAWWEKMVVR